MAPLRTVLSALAAAALLAIGLPGTASAAAATGSCYDYPITTIGKVSSPAPAIGCESPHSAETFWTGPVAESFGVPSKASAALRLAYGRPCTVKAMDAYLGIPDRALPTRYRTVALFPTDEQWAAGERWVRCDVVLQTGLGLQQTTGGAAAFVAATPAAALDFCTPSVPSAKNMAAVQCTNPKKMWMKVLDRELGGPTSTFPGTSAVQKKSAVICQQVAKRYNGKLQFPGWWRINPTQHGWTLGKRSVQCFVPLAQYQKTIAAQAPAPAPSPSPTPSA